MGVFMYGYYKYRLPVTCLRVSLPLWQYSTAGAPSIVQGCGVLSESFLRFRVFANQNEASGHQRDQKQHDHTYTDES